MIGALVRSVLAGLMVAGIVHVVAILLLPKAVPDDPTARIAAAAGPAGGVVLVPSDGSVLTDLDPYFLHAACPFDVSAATTLALTATLPDEVWTLAVVSRAGGLMASYEQDAAPDGAVSLLVGTPEAVERLRLSGAASASGFTVEAPSGPGFVLVRVAAADIESRPATRRALSAIACRTEALPAAVGPLAPLPSLPLPEAEDGPLVPLSRSLPPPRS